MNCPVCNYAPADARYSRTCSEQCESIHARREPSRLERKRCECGGEKHSRLEGGNVVIVCLRCRAQEVLSPLVVQSLVA